MIIVYDRKTGEIRYTIEHATSLDGIKLHPDEEDALITLVEHGSQIITLRVDVSGEIPKLLSKSAVILKPNKTAVKVGDSVAFSVQTEGEIFGNGIPLRINDQIVVLQPNQNSLEITFDMPGVYTLYVPDGRYYSPPVTITVKDVSEE